MTTEREDAAPDGTATLEALVARAVSGSSDALEAVVAAVQHDVYGLALRMLWHPEDAADAAQEILIKVVTNLASFRGESAFRTWCFRVASNHLLTARKSRAELRAVSFESLAEAFDARGDGRATASHREPEAAERADDALGEEEVKLGCTLGILMCLDRDHRLAYIVGEILALSSDEAAVVTEVDSVTYRKRLSRARARMRGFFEGHCGIVNPSATCRCATKTAPWTRTSELGPGRRLFTSHDVAPSSAPGDGRRLLPTVRDAHHELTALHASVALYRSHPDYAAPHALSQRIRELLRVRPLTVLGPSNFETKELS